MADVLTLWETIKIVDKKGFLFINRDCSNRILNEIMPVITDAGTAQFVFVIALFLVFNVKYRAKGLLLMAGSTVAYQFTYAVKELIERPRPYLVIPGVNVLASSSGFSFPSGHTAMIFMAAYIVLCYSRKWAIPAYILAFAVGFSRIYVGVHFPIDVIAGIMIGTISGHITMRIFNNIDFSKITRS
ncbi:MAG TPA: phosphatase PAP2 family protein [Candidatus Omnitrophota bacterium]|nr:phosphatase PAP2 family protein [Candidatus Omnitrophota bacterium]HPS20603.1 phosphatase PAP2 family protein [Candidatus Omnitrophota bacterium]